MKNQLKQLIQQSLTTLNLPLIDFAVEHPQVESHGDYASNVAMVLYPLLRKQGITDYSSPRHLAETIVNALQSASSTPFSAIEIAGPGFINFTLKPDHYHNIISQILQKKDQYGTSTSHKGKRVIVEYSSPNIAKPFTIGHLRSTIIGDAIANLKEATGWEVLRDNHLGDWGTQFGKLICAIKMNWLTMEEIETADHPVKLLVELYVRFHTEAESKPELEDEGRAWFKKLEAHDQEALAIWRKCIEWSWKEFSRIYDLLGIRFSPQFNQGRGLGESFFENKMAAVVNELTEKDLLKEGENGARLVFFPEEKFPPLMILKKDGTSLYATRDLATDKYRKDEFQPDLIINEVGSEQSLYFKQLYELEKMLGWYQDNQRIHVGHGLYRFAEGKMSTRKGNVIWLEDVLHEAGKRAVQVMGQAVKRERMNPEDEANLGMVIGIGALKWNDLKGDTKRDIVFNWDEILAMKGDSGPYIQYTYARAKSVLNKSVNAPDISDYYEMNEEEMAVAKWLNRYPEVIEEAAAQHTPSTVTTYLYELAQRFNTFYNKHSILGNDANPVETVVRAYRLQLTDATQQVLKNGLTILGIQTPEKM